MVSDFLLLATTKGRSALGSEDVNDLFQVIVLAPLNRTHIEGS